MGDREQLGGGNDRDRGAEGGGDQSRVEDPVKAAGEVDLEDYERRDQQHAEHGFRGSLHFEVASRRGVLALVHGVVGVDELAGLREQTAGEEVCRGPVVLPGGVLPAGAIVVLQCSPDQFLVVREVVGERHDGRLGGGIALRGGGERAQRAADGLLCLPVEAVCLGVRLFQTALAGT